MAEYIDKQAAIDLVNAIYVSKRLAEPDYLSPYHLGFFEGFYSACGNITVALENIRTVDIREEGGQEVIAEAEGE